MLLKSSDTSMGIRALARAAVGVMISALLSVAALVNAQDNEADQNVGIARLFANDSLLQVTIEAPLTTLMKDRPLEEYLDGSFNFIGVDGTERSLDLKIRTRGKFRRKKKHCDFAPIRLNFRRKQVLGTEFSGQDKLKLVTHCRKNPNYQQFVLREFLAYRFLNVMTPRSFGVRLLQINYRDTEGADPLTRLGFVIEDDDDVAERNGMHSIKTGNVSYDELDRMEQSLINVFQYMIGNTEYSLVTAEPGEYCCHNTDLMSASKGPLYTPVAYDFDFSGLVDAPYAAPHPRFKSDDVRRRLYRGLCEDNELLSDTFQRFLDNKDAIYSVVDNLELLSSRSRRSVTTYLDSFFSQISKPKSVNARFVKKCYDPE